MSVGPRIVSVAIAIVVGCATQKPPPSSPTPLVPADLYPLQAGNAWSYDVDTGDSSTTLGTTRVEAFDGRVAEVHTGRAVVRYEVLPEGIRVPPEDAWLLRAPLIEGATWPARGGRTARLNSTDASVETPAGHFERCVEIIETGGQLELVVRTVYCPQVGPVAVTSTMHSNVSDRALTVSAELRGYDVSPDRSPDR